jgi:DNA-binding LacI/PurR family transcriptional regulator
MAVTISDVAKKAKVSRTTVSRVLSNAQGFKYSDETRDKVQVAAKVLNYVPNAAAQLLRLKDTKMIGIVTQSTSPQLVHIQLEKCNEQLTSLGYHPILIDLNETYQLYGTNPLNRFDYLQGIICLHSKQAESVSRFCHEKNLDIQLLSMAYSDDLPGNVRVVATDHFKGMKKAVQHLSQLGHQRIGYLLYKPEGTDRKHDGFNAGIAELGLQGFDIDSTTSDRDATPFNCAYKCADYLIKKFDITAVICQNDESALALISGLIKNGIKVPQDISVMGYDNLPFAEFTNPSLTTLSQKLNELAHDVAKLLVSCVEANDIQREYLPSKLFIEPELIIRESTCAPEDIV